MFGYSQSQYPLLILQDTTSQPMHLWGREGVGEGAPERWGWGRGLSSELACVEEASAQPCFPRWDPREARAPDHPWSF